MRLGAIWGNLISWMFQKNKCGAMEKGASEMPNILELLLNIEEVVKRGLVELILLEDWMEALYLLVQALERLLGAPGKRFKRCSSNNLGLFG